MKWIADHRHAILGFSVAAAYWPGLLSAVYVPRWAVIAVGVPLVSTMDPRAISEPMRWVLLGLVGLCGVSILGSPDRLTGCLDMIFVLLLTGTFLAAAGFADLDGVMTGMGWGIGVSTPIAVLQFFGIEPVYQIAHSPAGLFFNSEVLAEFAAPVFVWAVLRPRWAIALITGIPLLICQSRVGVLAVAIALLYAWGPRSKAALSALIALIVVAAFAAIFLKFTSAGTRFVLWGATAMAITPLGNGLGWFMAAHPLEQFAHSDALQALAEIGFGAVALLFIPIVAFRNQRGTYAERAAFAAICVEVVLSFPLHLPASGFLAAVLAGYLVGRGPVLRLGQSDSRTENGIGVQRQDAADGYPVAERGRGRGAVSARSIVAGCQALCARTGIPHAQGA